MGLSRDNRWVALSLFLWGLGDGLFFYIRPLYLKSLGADPETIGGVLALTAAVLGATHMPAGYLADRFGRRQIILAGWVMAMLTTLVMYFADSLTGFVVGLVLYVSTTFVLAPLLSYVAEARGAQSVQRALSLVSAFFWGGSIISPALGGWIGQAFGLRTVFAAALAVFVLSTLAMIMIRPQAVAAPAGRNRYGSLFANRQLLYFLALMFVAEAALQLGIPLLPNFAVEVRGFDVAAVGVFGSLNSLGAVLLNVVLGQRTPRWGFMAAQAIMALSMLLLLTTSGVVWMGLAYMCQGGWNLSRSMALAQVRHTVEVSSSGLALGLTETALSGAAILAAFGAGVLYERSPALPFQVSLALIILTLPLMGWLAPWRNAQTGEAT